MAKLIITLPTIRWLELIKCSDIPETGIPIFVDGRCITSIMPEKRTTEFLESFLDPSGVIPVTSIMPEKRTIEWQLAPGRHQVMAGTAFGRSQQVEIEAAEAETHWFALGLSPRLRKLFGLSLILSLLCLLPFLVMALWFPRLAIRGRSALVDDWYFVFLGPILVLALAAMLFPLCVMFVTRNDALVLVKVPDLDWTEEQVAGMLRSQRYRPRITIRDLMIAVAILALLFAGSIAWVQHQRSDQFRMQAKMHDEVEKIARDGERQFLGLAADLEKGGLNGNGERQTAAKWCAQADYHAAMKRKYEQAAARAAFFVEPDPPAPPTP